MTLTLKNGIMTIQFSKLKYMRKILVKIASAYSNVKKNSRWSSFQNQRGVNVVEFLLIIAILVVLALMIIPNINTFLGVDKKIAAANVEAQNIRTAVLAYENNNPGIYPEDSEILFNENYIGQPKAYYTIDKGKGRIINASTDTIGHIPDNPWTGIKWDYSSGSWVKQ